MKRAAIAALLGGMLAMAGAALPASGAPLSPTAPAALAAIESGVHLASKRTYRAKGKSIKKVRAKRTYARYPSRYHSWSKWDYETKLHSRRYVGEKYHRHCGDWHRCHYYFYGYLQWEKWNPGGSRKAFLKRYHH